MNEEMTDKKQKQIKVLTIILGVLTLSFILIAGTGLTFVMVTKPTPVTIRVDKTVVIKMETVEPKKSKVPNPTLNAAQTARAATRLVDPFPMPIAPPYPTPVPRYIKTMRRLGELNMWGETLSIILMLIIITGVMLYIRSRKEK